MDKIRRAIERHHSSVQSKASDCGNSEGNHQKTEGISAVDVYIAYRQYNRAKELLHQAIEREPQRLDLKLKLFSVLFATSDVDTYVELFRKNVGDALSQEDPDGWKKVVQMGAKMDPANPLFSRDADLIAKDEIELETPDLLKNVLESDDNETVLTRSETDKDEEIHVKEGQGIPTAEQPIVETIEDTVPRVMSDSRRAFLGRFAMYGSASALMLAVVLGAVFWKFGTFQPVDKEVVTVPNAAAQDGELQGPDLTMIEEVVSDKADRLEIITENTSVNSSVAMMPVRIESQMPDPKKNDSPVTNKGKNIEHNPNLNSNGNAVSGSSRLASTSLATEASPATEQHSVEEAPPAIPQHPSQTDDSLDFLFDDRSLLTGHSGLPPAPLKKSSSISVPSSTPAPLSALTPPVNKQESLSDKVTRLLKEAESYRQRRLLTTPKGSNSYEIYQQVLMLDPQNATAKQGVHLIADDYSTLAIKSMQNEKIEQSRVYIERGLKLVPAHRGLLKLRGELTEQASPELTEVRTEDQSITQLLDSIQQMQQQIDQLSSNRKASAQGGQTNEYIEKLTSQVQELLNQEKTSEALRLVQNGLKVMPQHPRLVEQEKAIKQIKASRTQGTKEAARFVRGLMAQAAEHRKNGELEESLTLIDVGLRLMRNHRPLLDLRESLVQEIQGRR